MTGRQKYRPILWPITTVAILSGSWASPLVSATLASEQEGRVSVPSVAAAPTVQISADGTLDLHRLEMRRANGEIFDLFSRPASQASGRATGKSTTKAAGVEAGSSKEVDRKGVSVPDKETEEEEDVPSAVNASLSQPAPSVPTPPPAPAVIPTPTPAPKSPAGQPAPSITTAPSPPPAPKPPALPFAYMGKFEQDARTIYFLVKADKLYTVTDGEDIDETYRFEGKRGNQLRIIYKPLQIAQTLTVEP